MSYIIELLQVSCMIFFSIIFLLDKKHKSFIVLYPTSTFLGCTVAIACSYRAYIMCPLYLLLFLLIPLFLSKAKKTKILYFSLFSVCFTSFINSLVNLLLYYFACPNIEYITIIITSLLFLLLFVVILLNKKMLLAINTLFNISTSINLIIILFLGLFFILLLTENLALLFPQKRIIFALSFVTVILLLSCIVFIAFLINNIIKKMYYERVSNLLNNTIEQQIKHYENTIRAYDNLRTFKHDYNNLKIGLTSLLKENKTDEAIKYLNDFNNITGNDTVIKTGNTVVDAIISDKSSDLQRHNINISFTGIIPYDAMNISDLCIAFGNALDNAIEACSKMQPESAKNISVEVHQVNNLLIIKLTNPVFQKVEINNNTANTSKDDPLSHGIGIYSISTTVQKYNGYYKIDCNDTDFTLEMGFFI